MMSDLNRMVAGITCGEVLAELSEYLSGDLESDRRGQLEAHVAGCDVCAQFGGRFGELVARLRSELLGVSPIPAEVVDRLAARLATLD